VLASGEADAAEASAAVTVCTGSTTGVVAEVAMYDVLPPLLHWLHALGD